MKTLFKHISRLLCLSLLLVMVEGKGQVSPTASFHMERDGLVKWNDCAADIGSIYNITQAKATFGSFYTRYMAEGQVDPVTYPNHTDANFLKIGEWVATWNNFVWAGHAAGHIHPQTGKLVPCQSRTNIESGAGNYMIDYPADYAFGHYKGQGSSVSYHGGTVQQGSTSLVLDIANWVGNPSNMSVFIGATWGREDLSSYQEAFVLSDFRLIGSKTSEVYNSAIESSGILTWDPGSVSRIENIFAENFNTAGLHCVRGTSLSVGTSTWFRNNLAGIWLQGGGMHCFDGVQEFDENPTCFLINGGYGRTGGSTGELDFAKTESGYAPGRPADKDQTFMDAEGWINWHVGTIEYSNVSGVQYTMARINATVNSSHFTVDNFVPFGPVLNIMHDLANNKVCRMDGAVSFNGYFHTDMHDLKWSSKNGGVFKFDFVPNPNIISNVSDARYESILTDPNTGAMVSAYNEATGKPAYKFGQYAGVSVPPVPVCTIVYTVTRTCSNGQWDRRTAVVTPTGCATAPADSLSRTCAVTPGTAKLTKTNIVMSTKDYCDPVSPAITITKVVITDLVVPNLNYPRIVGGGSNSLPSLKVWPDGTIRMGNGNPLNTVKVVAGVKWSGTITVSGTVGSIGQDRCTEAGAQPGTTIGKLELY